MGFHVQLEGGAGALLRKLKTTPAVVFDRPYKGYLLFLAGAADQDACQWIASNTFQLDSLTGRDIAFAVFARRFAMRLRVPSYGSNSGARWPTLLGEISPENLVDGAWTVERLVKSGRWGWVINGDELAAVTYAVDDIAKNLGVLDKLPCVIVLDAIPQSRINVIHLTPVMRESFIDLLRKSMAKLSRVEGYDRLDHNVQRLLRIYAAIEPAKHRRAAVERVLKSAESALGQIEARGPVSPAEIDEISGRLVEATNALRSGSLREFRFAVTGGRKGLPTKERSRLPGLLWENMKAALHHAEGQHKSLHTLARTIQALKSLASEEEPNRPDRFQLIVDKYVRKLLGERTCNNLTLGSISELIQELEHGREYVVASVMAHIPTQAELVSNLEAAQLESHKEHLSRARDKVAMLRAQLDALNADPEGPVRDAQASYEAAIQEYLSGRPPSLWAAISQTLREMKLTNYVSNVQLQASEVAAGIFNANFLLKVWEALAR